MPPQQMGAALNPGSATDLWLIEAEIISIQMV